MEIKTAIKKLSKLIPKSSVIEISKAIDYDSRFEGGAKVIVDIPQSPNDIVEPKIVDYEQQKKSISNAFDDVEIEDVSRETLEPVIEEKPIETPKKEEVVFDLSDSDEDEDEDDDDDDDIDFKRMFGDDDDDEEDIEKSKTLF
jgi:hypothetical protein